MPRPNTAVKPPASGNWNAQDIVIGKIRRINVEGLDVDDSKSGGTAGVGNVRDDAKEGGEWGGEGRVDKITKEKAIGKALVLVPEPFDKSIKTVDVMIYLHGYGIGYRQRVHTRQQDVGTKDKPKVVDEAGMESGTVRDIEVDHMEEQLDAVNARRSGGWRTTDGRGDAAGPLHRSSRRAVRRGVSQRGLSRQGVRQGSGAQRGEARQSGARRSQRGRRDAGAAARQGRRSTGSIEERRRPGGCRACRRTWPRWCCSMR